MALEEARPGSVGSVSRLDSGASDLADADTSVSPGSVSRNPEPSPFSTPSARAGRLSLPAEDGEDGRARAGASTDLLATMAAPQWTQKTGERSQSSSCQSTNPSPQAPHSKRTRRNMPNARKGYRPSPYLDTHYRIG